MVKKSSHGVATLGLVAAAAAGAYLLYGKHAKKNRKLVKSWAIKARAEVLEKIEALKQIDKASYQKAIDDVTTRYRTIKNVSSKELAELARELKSHWNDISKEMSKKKKK